MHHNGSVTNLAKSHIRLQFENKKKNLYSSFRTRGQILQKKVKYYKASMQMTTRCQLLVRILLRATTFQQRINFPVACQVRHAKAGR